MFCVATIAKRAKEYYDLELAKEKPKMTRNEFRNKFISACIVKDGDLDSWIDFFEQTGIVKFEEEKTVENKLRIIGYGKDLIAALDKIGLKVVFKND